MTSSNFPIKNRRASTFSGYSWSPGNGWQGSDSEEPSKGMGPVLWVFLAITGALLAGALIWGGILGAHLLTSESVQGEVVQKEEVHVPGQTNTMYRITVAYDVDGQRYSVSPSGTQSSAPDLGEPMTVRYKKDDPSDARLNDFFAWIGPLALLASALLIGGLAYLFHRLQGSARASADKNQQNTATLQQTGQRVQAVVESYSEKRAANDMGPTGLLVAKRDDPSTKTTYRYKHTYAVTPLQAPTVGSTVTVLVDPTDPSNYVFELPEA